ncbi:uncharacterized protein TRIADDRAFT_61706 [Trichoplax adhaerens]|uniref:Bridge-like lipid transfer protein family member 1 C-terminal domain-containing protein n=1 Tax=Trichoplax adhaerens TaxID=10228 RepID=B3SBR2_TRIAD|nr:hypothetical protein TRIADDRAFT_61706 [Trichoplax adhaerens]EDV19837.1 hypothetical protein TRIADDRAFT_61706 [Trichoplax adhaerens]|eukprot:XP_002117707.1 hypothetical protein TRIADDRAFT_61706 [Trichoplax adhaerens]
MNNNTTGSVFPTIDPTNSTIDYTRHVILTVLTIVWTIYVSYYNSRVMGLIVTWILNRAVHYGDFSIGSVSVSFLSGKIMFRAFRLVTKDYSIRLMQLVYDEVEAFQGLIFVIWYPLTEHDLSQSRIYVVLNGFQFHVYNRSSEYDRLFKLFTRQYDLETGAGNKDSTTSTLSHHSSVESNLESTKESFNWRDLIPAIKFDITAGRISFGNYLMPYTLHARFESASCVYFTTEPASNSDLYTHVCNGQLKAVRVMFSPSPEYLEYLEMPPRNMGENSFEILNTRDIWVKYYQDKAGYVPYDGCEESNRSNPAWGIDVEFGKDTSIRYGPWVHRQKDALQHFFYPKDYQKVSVSNEHQPGSIRTFRQFEIGLFFRDDATMDVLFSKNEEIFAVYFCFARGSCSSISIPLVCSDNGYSTISKGTILNLEVYTSLEYRNFLKCDIFNFSTDFHFPRWWNDEQQWTCDLGFHKITWYFIFAHKKFFQDIISDFSSKKCPDLYDFSPYTMNLNISLKDFEMIWLANMNNWIDCFSQFPENAELAICGRMMDLSMNLPFTEYLPERQQIGITVQVDNAVARLYIPECNTSRRNFINLAYNYEKLYSMKSRDSISDAFPFEMQSKSIWSRIATKSDGWIDCWFIPVLAADVSYIYHPEPIQPDWLPYELSENEPDVNVDPLSSFMNKSPNIMKIVFDIGGIKPGTENCTGSKLRLFGSFIHFLLNVKGNYFGQYQKFFPFDPYFNVEDEDIENFTFESSSRPFTVLCSVNIYDVEADLVQYCEDLSEIPKVTISKLVVEISKEYKETRIQVISMPMIINVTDNVQRPSLYKDMNHGFLSINGFHLRVHAMFSGEGRPVGSSTTEYAFMLEAKVESITGKLTTPQAISVVSFFEIFIHFLSNSENHLQSTVPSLCQHDRIQSACCVERDKDNNNNENDNASKWSDFECPGEDELRYYMIRLGIDRIQVQLVETGCICDLQLSHLRLSQCSLHSPHMNTGRSVVVKNITLKQYLRSELMDGAVAQAVNRDKNEWWLEVATVVIGPINVDMSISIAKSYLNSYQEKWLRRHDRKSKRLYFLWHKSYSSITKIKVCGCQGGCVFFDKNIKNCNFLRFNIDPIVNEDEDAATNNGKADLESGSSVKNVPSPGDEVTAKTETESGEVSLRSSKRASNEYQTLNRSKGSSRYSNADGSVNRSVSFERKKPQAQHSQSSAFRPLNKQISFTSDTGDLFSNRRSIIADFEQSFSKQFNLKNRGESFVSCDSGSDSLSLADYTDSLNTLRHARSLSAATVDTFRTAPSSFSSLQSLAQMDDNDDVADVTVTHERIKAEIIHEESIEDDIDGNEDTVVFGVNSVSFDRKGVTRRRSKSNSKQDDGHITDSFSSIYHYYVVSCNCSNRPDDNTDGEEIIDLGLGEPYSFKAVGDRTANIPLLFHRESKESQVITDNSSSDMLNALEADLEPECSRSTIILDIPEPISIFITPFVMKAIECYTKPLVPVLQNLHPCCVLNKAHSKCINDTLMKKKHLDHKLATQLKCFVSIRGIDIAFYQAFLAEKIALSEELIARESLHQNHAKSLRSSGASLLALSFDRVKGQISHILRNRNVDSNVNNVNDNDFLKNEADEDVNNQTKALSGPSIVLEEQVAELSSNRLHCQLRRLPVGTSDDLAIINGSKSIIAIPENDSRVYFVPSFNRGIDIDTEEITSEITKYRDGWIMVEFGIEGFTAKGGRIFGLSVSEVIGTSDKELNLNLDSYSSSDYLSDAENVGTVGDKASKTVLTSKANGIMQLNHVWFNFASPTQPRNLHWSHQFNLLTTVIPATSAWISTASISESSIRLLLSRYNCRIRAVFAYLMTECVETAGRYLPLRYAGLKLTESSNWLQDNECCQLLYILIHFMPDVDSKRMLTSLNEDYVPSLNTLRGGLLALVRQWKAILVRPGRPEACRKKVLDSTGKKYGLVPATDTVDSSGMPPVSLSFVSSTSLYDGAESSRPTTNYESHDRNEATVGANKFANFVALAMEKQKMEKATPLNPALETVPSTSLHRISEDLRSSAEDIISRIPSKSGQLAHLSSLGSLDSGKYHHTEADKFSNEETDIEASKDDQSVKDINEKISFPTTGIRLTEATVVFRSLLRCMAIDTGDCRDEPYRSTLSLSGELRLLSVYVVSSNTVFDVNTSSSYDSDNVTEPTDHTHHVSSVFVCEEFLLDLFMHQDPVVSLNPLYETSMANKFDKSTSGNPIGKQKVDLKNRWLIKLETKRITHDLNLSLLRLIHHLTNMVEPLQQYRKEIWDDLVDSSPVLPGDRLNNQRVSIVSTNVENLRRIATNRVWLTMYKLLDCYSAMGVSEGTADAEVAAKLGAGTFQQRLRAASLSTKVPETPDVASIRRRGIRLRLFSEAAEDMPERRKTTAVQYLRQLHAAGVERVDPMSVICVIKVQEISVTANVGRLHLKATIARSHFSATYRMKQPVVIGVVKKPKTRNDLLHSTHSSFVGNVGDTEILLLELEKKQAKERIIVCCNVNASKFLLSSITHTGKVSKSRYRNKHSGIIFIGAMLLDIPQHPASLQHVVERSTRTITQTMSEFYSSNRNDIISRSNDIRSLLKPTSQRKHTDTPQQLNTEHSAVSAYSKKGNAKVSSEWPIETWQFRVNISNVVLGAALLPSLRGEYKMKNIRCLGMWGQEQWFKMILADHSLNFLAKEQSIHLSHLVLPTATTFQLPTINIYGLKVINSNLPAKKNEVLDIVVRVGTVKQILMLDILTYLLVVQKSFLEEINKVLGMVYSDNQLISTGSSKATPKADKRDDNQLLLYSVKLKMEEINLTARTATAFAVRLNTGKIEGEIANFLFIENRKKKQIWRKLHGFLQLKIRLSLGQLSKESILQQSANKETFLVNAIRPSVYVQSAAFNKAVMLYINYKNVYENWLEQRRTLASEFRTISPKVQPKAKNLGDNERSSSVFLQLNVLNFGICLPLTKSAVPADPFLRSRDYESNPALLCTVDSMLITACNSTSLAVRGHFKALCIRFTDSMGTDSKFWAPNLNQDCIMNSCIVPDGTYECCSKSERYKSGESHQSAGKWSVVFCWRIFGINMSFDQDIGRYLSLLGDALTLMNEADETSDIGSITDESDEFVDSFETFDDRYEDYDVMDKYIMGISHERDTEANQSIIDEDFRHSHLSKDFEKKRRNRMSTLERQTGGDTAKIQKHRRRLSVGKKIFNYRRTKHMSLLASGYDGDIERESGKPLSQMLETNRNEDFTGHVVTGASGNDTVIEIQPDTTDSQNKKKKVSIKEDPACYLSYDEGDQAPSVAGSFTQSKSSTDMKFDFELDVVLQTDTGKCTLYSQSMKQADEYGKIRSIIYEFHLMKKMIRKRSHTRDHLKSSKWRSRKAIGSVSSAQLESTILMMPDIDIKLRYTTLNQKDEDESNKQYQPSSLSADTGSESFGTSAAKLKTVATLHLWLYLHSLADEIILTPSLVDFLEGALGDLTPAEEILSRRSSVDMFYNQDIHSRESISSEEDENSVLTANRTSLSNITSFPVNAFVYVRVEPLDIRLSCMPVSRVECLLQLPSLDLMFTSHSEKKVSMAPYIGLESCAVSSGNSSASLSENIPHGTCSTVSFTGYLERFSFSIFHPYGRQHQPGGRARNNSFASSRSNTDGRDSLSLHVESAKVSITRKRIIISQNERSSNKFDITDLGRASDPSANKFRVKYHTAGLFDIKSAEFNYDMRGLSEILDVPKAWYRNSIARRLFLGNVGDSSNTQTRSSETPQSNWADGKEAMFERQHSNEFKLTVPAIERQKSESITDYDSMFVLACNLQQLVVTANMGSIMGPTNWSTNEVKCRTCLYVGHSGYNNLDAQIAIGRSSIDSRSGTVGGLIELQEFSVSGQFRDNYDWQPQNAISLSLLLLDARLDYMSTPTIMAHLTNLKASLYDKWNIVTTQDPELSSIGSMGIKFSESPSITLHGNVQWCELYAAISQSSPTNLIKIIFKLEECFRKQQRSSKRALGGRRQSRMRGSSIYSSNREQSLENSVHHWIRPLRVLNKIIFKSGLPPLDLAKVNLEGNFSLYGSLISLACFDGLNFTEKVWSLFYLQRPAASFVTSISFSRDKEVIARVKHSLDVNIGNSKVTRDDSKMHRLPFLPSLAGVSQTAKVCRITRFKQRPPNHGNVQDWLVYACVTPIADSATRRHYSPQMGGFGERKFGTMSSKMRPSRLRGIYLMPDERYELDVETVFSFPETKLTLETNHTIPALTLRDLDGENDREMTIDTSCNITFENSIWLSQDVNHFIFLHQMINNYIKGEDDQEADKPRFVSHRNFERKFERAENTLKMLQMRRFTCSHWYLDPKIQFLSWAGERTDPVGIDWVLNKLGFENAHSTIPKYLQRGLLDPMDVFVALVLYEIIKDNNKKNSQSK